MDRGMKKIWLLFQPFWKVWLFWQHWQILCFALRKSIAKSRIFKSRLTHPFNDIGYKSLRLWNSLTRQHLSNHRIIILAIPNSYLEITNWLEWFEVGRWHCVFQRNNLQSQRIQFILEFPFSCVSTCLPVSNIFLRRLTKGKWNTKVAAWQLIKWHFIK